MSMRSWDPGPLTLSSSAPSTTAPGTLGATRPRRDAASDLLTGASTRLTGRVDTAATFRARNRTTTPPGARHHFAGHQPPARSSAPEREPLRASDPSGPMRRGRVHRFRAAAVPELAVAAAQVVDFGKF